MDIFRRTWHGAEQIIDLVHTGVMATPASGAIGSVSSPLRMSSTTPSSATRQVPPLALSQLRTSESMFDSHPESTRSEPQMSSGRRSSTTVTGGRCPRGEEQGERVDAAEEHSIPEGTRVSGPKSKANGASLGSRDSAAGGSGCSFHRNIRRESEGLVPQYSLRATADGGVTLSPR